MKRAVIIASSLLVLLVAVWYFAAKSKADTGRKFEFAEITRGDVENIVSSTGTLEAVGTVEVGTQVSGIVARVLVDFNDPVRKGQLLAMLDTTLLAVSIKDAEAGLLKAKAQYRQAQNNHRRTKEMFAKKLVSELEYSNSETNVQAAFAAVQSAEAALKRAKANLNYAFIRSPIDGKVVFRNVERGQTVAASLSAPTLFVIAENLSQMEIHAQVDESDIGQIEEGQSVRFEVPAYPEKTFTGKVRQIRLQPDVIQNVVNYTVVIDARNDEGLLLPGMTATVDFIVAQRQDVLLVPNAALRFQPPEEMLQEFRKRMQKRFASRGDSSRAARRQGFFRRGNFRGGDGFGAAQRGLAKQFGRVWTLDEDGHLAMVPLRIGVTDGKMTEIVRSRGLEEGQRVITGLVTSTQQSKKRTNPRSFRRFSRRPF
ncbi:MAG: efflux RND transporter periplasmic adaptor subunit [Calditrichaeota bacterium]|nr:MAG: efflux RND transporter periplasmic adaptor subunit [Calditrichota bacterium]